MAIGIGHLELNFLSKWTIIKNMVKDATPKKKKQRTPDIERRRWPRLQPSSVPFLKSVSLPHGIEVKVFNISQGGMLLETGVRLGPQIRIHLKILTTDGFIQVSGSVMRSYISSLVGGPTYRSAIAFDDPLRLPTDLVPEPKQDESMDFQQGSDAQWDMQPDSQLIVGELADKSGVLTIVIPGSSDTPLVKNLKQNDW